MKKYTNLSFWRHSRYQQKIKRILITDILKDEHVTVKIESFWKR